MELLLAFVVALHSWHSIQAQVLHQIGRLYIPNTGIPGAENAAIDYENNRIFVASGSNTSVNSFDFDIDDNVTSADIEPSVNILVEPAFGELGLEPVELQDITCVAMSSKGYVLATVVPMNNSITNGWLAFIDPGNQSVFHLMELEECYLPDHVTSTNDGHTILVSCEGEPSQNEERLPSVDPRGSVGYIDVSATNKSEWHYSNIEFTHFDVGGSKSALLPDDIYIPLAPSIPDDQGRFSMSAEPEHIVVDESDTYAYIGLQESNAIAVLDIETKEIINVFSLGRTDFGIYGLDASDKDGGINITTYDNVYAMRQPDDIDFWAHHSGRSFVFTANEGDSKGWDEARVEDLELDIDVFGNGTNGSVPAVQRPEQLGRLKVSKLLGSVDGYDGNDTEYEELVTFSSRDFTVFEVVMDDDGVPVDLQLQFSSGNDFERITAERIPEGFNSDYTTGTFDERSDAKGPEPEALTVGECENGRLFVFIAFERVGGIIVYDFTDIDNITFADYVNNRNFSVNYTDEEQRPPDSAGDIGPEQMRFIPGDVYGEALLLVSNPQSASITMYRIDCGEAPVIPVVTTTAEPKDRDDGQDNDLRTWEYVAIGVGSFAIVSIVALLVFMAWRRKQAVMVYRYTSRDHGNNATSAPYVEMEN